MFYLENVKWPVLWTLSCYYANYRKINMFSAWFDRTECLSIGRKSWKQQIQHVANQDDLYKNI